MINYAIITMHWLLTVLYIDTGFRGLPGWKAIVAAHNTLTVGLNDPPRVSQGQGAIPKNVLQLAPKRRDSVKRYVQLEDNRIRLQISGLYFVYSQVTFVHISNGESIPLEGPHGHYVYRHNTVLPNDGNEQLLRSCKTVADNAQGSNFIEQTSFTAGLFKLRAQDELFVNVSDVRSVSHKLGASYLGLYKV